jgi:hypothetical protein
MDEVYIEFEEYGENAFVDVYNLQGQDILSENFNLSGNHRFKLDFSDEPAGLYIMQVRYSDLEVKKKIIRK